MRLYASLALVCLALAGCSQKPIATQTPVPEPPSATQSGGVPAPVMPPTSTPAISTSPTPQGQPKTLEAATAAAQEKTDRFASGDFAGEWMMFPEWFRNSVSQADYVTYSKACSKNGIPITVTGVRMEDTDTAIVRLDVMGFKDSRTMVYEDGQWVQEPADKIVKNIGKPVQQWIADCQE